MISTPVPTWLLRSPADVCVVTGPGVPLVGGADRWCPLQAVCGLVGLTWNRCPNRLVAVPPKRLPGPNSLGGMQPPGPPLRRAYGELNDSNVRALQTRPRLSQDKHNLQ